VIPSGPYVLASGATQYFNDPTAYQPRATNVQIQNSSAFLLTVQIGGANYLIQPFTASTIPTNNSYQLVVTPGYPQSNFGVLLSLAWLQLNESAPMADGPLTQGSQQSLGLLSAAVTPTSSTAVQILPAPPTGYVYSLYSYTVSYTGATGNVSVAFTPQPPTYSFGQNVASPWPPISLGGTICTAAEFVSVGPNTPPGFTVTVTLRYDLFPQPAS
jgi:hypothetical protein